MFKNTKPTLGPNIICFKIIIPASEFFGGSDSYDTLNVYDGSSIGCGELSKKSVSFVGEEDIWKVYGSQ
jgi:hypothetical protein